MSNRINNLVELFFEDIPYSEEVVKAQEDIRAALDLEYRKFCEESSENTAFEMILEKYGKLSDMAILAGYSDEDARNWCRSKETKGLAHIKKEITRQKRKIYLLSILWLWAGAYIITMLLIRSFFPLIFAAVFGLLACLFHKKYSKKEEALTQVRQYDTDAYLYIRTLADKYAKRTLNGIALLSAVAAFLVFYEISFLVSNGSKLVEVLENIYANVIFLEIPAYLCIKNIFCVRLIQRRINLPDKKRFKKHLSWVLAFSAAYWLVVTVFVLFYNKHIRHPANLFIIAGILFALLILIYNFIFRKRITFRNICVNWRRALTFTIVIVLVYGYTVMQRDTWYTQPYINATPVVAHNEHDISYNEENGVYTITSSTDDFKILHLTDIHLGGSLYSFHKDIKALKAVYDEIEYTHPDLVIVTGDLTFPLGLMSLSLNNSAPVSQFAAFMRNVDIPWAFTYGNHDTEAFSSLSKSDLNELYKQLSYKTSGNLLYPYVQPDVTGRSNQLIEIRNSDGTLKQAIFLIDSNAYTGEGFNVYDYIHDDQVDWYAGEVKRLNGEEGSSVSSMVFFHIPLQQYRTAYELYEQGSDEVKYFFGENGEEMFNKVCCSDYPSKLFDTMLELGSTKAVFCGHDHYNNMSLEYKGIRLTYGMSIDYLAMPGIENDTKQRGAELITLHADSSWEIEQVPLMSIQK